MSINYQGLFRFSDINNIYVVSNKNTVSHSCRYPLTNENYYLGFIFFTKQIQDKEMWLRIIKTKIIALVYQCFELLSLVTQFNIFFLLFTIEKLSVLLTLHIHRLYLLLQYTFYIFFRQARFVSKTLCALCMQESESVILILNLNENKCRIILT